MLIIVYGLIMNMKIAGMFFIQVLLLLLYSAKYGKYLQVKESKDVAIIDEIEDNSGFAYLKPKGKVFCVRILITTYLYFE